nr:MAG TPA: hypothetical protein [Caudoviricetes sp.]DAM18752.1 MAG TPA: hypothetical protein [Caudoviricetes sp.]DAW86268.1 MAG TPA: hypothetical protein [Caudoviricetes sp.]
MSKCFVSNVNKCFEPPPEFLFAFYALLIAL